MFAALIPKALARLRIPCARPRAWVSLGCLAWVGLMVSAAWAYEPGSTTVAASSDPHVCFRVIWGGPKNANYTGSIELDSGAMTCLQELGIDATDTSFADRGVQGPLLIQDNQTRFGGVDIAIPPHENATLSIQLQVNDPESQGISTKHVSWKVKDLLEQSHLIDLELGHCKLSIDRSPGDRLRVVTNRSHLIYNSNEPLNMAIQPCSLPWPDSQVQFTFELFRSGAEPALARQAETVPSDAKGNVSSLPLHFNAPNEEGVYELRCKATPKRMLPGWLTKAPSQERTIQFVVCNSAPLQRSLNGVVAEAHSPQAGANWTGLGRISSQAWTIETLKEQFSKQTDAPKRFPFLQMAKSFASGQRNANHRSNTNSKSLDGEGLTIDPGKIATAITSLESGRLHKLALRVSSPHARCRLLISPLSPDGKPMRSMPLLDESLEASALHTIHRALGNAPSLDEEVFEVLFWPTSSAVHVEIQNQNDTNELILSEVAVERWNGFAKTASEPQHRYRSSPHVLELGNVPVRQLIGDVPRQGGQSSLQVYDDWEIMWRFANQLGEYCNAQSIGTVAMPVQGGGSSLYPTRQFSSTARLDTGTFGSEGRDPFRKDIVELLLRVLPKYGVEFVPMLQLDGRFREIEDLVESQQERDCWLDRNADSSSHSDRLYNPFHPRVQRAVSNGLQEFVARYENNPGYSGFAIRIAHESMFELPLPIQDIHGTLLHQFSQRVGGKLPKDVSQRDLFIEQHAMGAFRQWTRESVSQFFSSLKHPPKWISVADASTWPNSTDQSLGEWKNQASIQYRSPQSLGSGEAGDSAVTLTEWWMGKPQAAYWTISRLASRHSASWMQLNGVAGPFFGGEINSIPYRNPTRSLSKVRAWQTASEPRSYLLVNAGAVVDKIRLSWDVLPQGFHIQASQGDASGNGLSWLRHIDPSEREWILELPAGEAIRIDLSGGESARAMYWASDEGELYRLMETAMGFIEQAVTRLSVPVPNESVVINSSFDERDSSQRSGHLHGWATSLDPSANLTIDNSHAVHGTACIKVETEKSTSLAWLQSEPFVLAHQDRLHIAFQTAAERIPEQATLSLWMFNNKSDRFEPIAIREFANRYATQRDGLQWTPLGFDVTQELLAARLPNELNLYRVQFEIRGQGTLWLDQVSLSTEFLREDERRAVRSELFLAKNSLQGGDAGPAVSILQSTHSRLIEWSDRSLQTSQRWVSQREPNSSQEVANSQAAEPPARTLDPAARDRANKPVRTGRRSKTYWWQRRE